MPPPTATLSTKIKVQLKLALTRLRMIQSRDASLTRSSHRSVAQLLEAHKLDSARIRVESIIRADILTEVHEILELYCELLLARFPLLDASGVTANGGKKKAGEEAAVTCEPGLEEAVKSIIYAAPRTEIKELSVLRVLLGEKFGKEFLAKAMEGVPGGVSEKVVKRLSVEPPKPELVEGYLEEIASAYGVEWAGSAKKKEEELDLLIDTGEGDGGGGDEGAPALKELEFLDETSASSPLLRPSAVSPSSNQASSSPEPRPKEADRGTSSKATEMKPVSKQKSTAEPAPAPAAGGVPDLTELERRFAALKKIG
ncbi:hypothetical protein VUR80DRAFT_6774 [Thermomyces stellatus]